ncbi:MAG TPA: DUF3147 family protein [Candidatus Angelobacter sp.]|nr:DUF3147 family protein [Candidatus Angelobacter sp.]
MKITVSFARLRQSSWREVVLRFGLGGLITALAGLAANEFGPIIGGFFLAFPSIFPASVTLVEQHEAGQKREQGVEKTSLARQAAGVDAAGAALGAFGLMAFAGVVWALAADHPTWIVLASGSFAWIVVAASAWMIRNQL